MTAATRELLLEALALTPMERAELIEALLVSFDPGPDQAVAETSKVGAASRIDAYESGELTDDSAEAMFDRINRR